METFLLDNQFFNVCFRDMKTNINTYKLTIVKVTCGVF